MRLEEHVAHHLCHKLVLLLQRSGAGRAGQFVEHLACAEPSRETSGRRTEGAERERRSSTSVEMSICA